MNNATNEKLVAVIGGSRGIGAQVCRRLARNGQNVAIVYRADKQACDTLLAELKEAGVKAIALQADIADENAVVDAFARIKSFGTLVGLVNSAGIGGNQMTVEGFEAEALSRMFQVNVVGLMLCCREAVRQMAVPRGGVGGAIVNISSMAATIGGRSKVTPYAASKAAVDGFTIGAAKELAPLGIRVFSVRPGATVTDMTSPIINDPARLAAVERTIAVGRLASVDEISAPIVRLLDEEMAYLSGARIDAAGGGLVF
ncbi:SDR family NAD(P)-dependent oxidoreductase [Devosia rhodophyticola]|uniref:SDR family NAD(P)-dependent oxidoreductase n=1 Tax=Devosia rhodophyticola TaxID=3026423 RepID=A0ABY7YXA9_9HYPH|nr:SDR family NAD(P)-dependent oxidoreductase [Devosia rhodophyticola]WDR06023.1 SDR family NAD(P)-dependent oxidoreductase [Devosia rhodophyticola]